MLFKITLLLEVVGMNKEGLIIEVPPEGASLIAMSL